MRFLADESCDFAVVRALWEAGFDVTAIGKVSPGATDKEVIELAVAESRILLTEDKDFGQLVFASMTPSGGVIQIRFPANARKTMVQMILELVREYGHKIEGRFVVVQPGRIRLSDIQE